MFFLKLNEKDQLTNNFWVAEKETMQKLSAEISYSHFLLLAPSSSYL